MSSQEPQKSKIDLLIEKVDRLENMFLEVMSDPSLKQQVDILVKLSKDKDLSISVIDNLNEIHRKLCNAIDTTASKMSLQIDGVMMGFSAMESKIKQMSYRIEAMPQLIPGLNNLPFSYPHDKYATNAGYPKHSVPVTMAMTPNGPRPMFNPMLPPQFMPRVSQPADEAMLLMDFLNELNSDRTDTDGMLDPVIHVNIINKRICLYYNPLRSFQPKIKKVKLVKDLLTTIESYYKTESMKGIEHPTSSMLCNVYVADPSNEWSSKPVKSMEDFLNWIIDNEQMKN